MALYLLHTYEPKYSIDNTDILIQHVEIFKKTPLLLHNHDYYEITLVEEGNSIHCVNKKYVPMSRAYLMFIRPDDEHCYLSYKSENYTMFNVRMSKEVYESIRDFLGGATLPLEKTELPVSVRVPEEELKRLAARLREIKSMPTSPFRGACLKSLFCDVFIELLRERGTGDGMPEWLSGLLDRLAKSFASETDLNALARESGVTREHMCRSFRKYLNATPSQYINALRLQNAARLLTYSDRDIIEISSESGFNNLGYFYRLFTDYFKIPPNQYRAQMRERPTKYAKRLF